MDTPSWEALQRRLAHLPLSRRRLAERLLAKDALRPELAPLVDTVRPPARQDLEQGPNPDRYRSVLSDGKEWVRTFYDSVNASLDTGSIADYALFLNYGYADGEHRGAEDGRARHGLNRNNVRLVLEVLGDCVLDGVDVLDVGCGRGGTIDTISRHSAPRRLTGVDLSSHAIRFCRDRHRRPHVTFVESDAEHLPFPAGAFDIVVNIESSHSYPNLGSFYDEVARVLRVGGRFLYADLLPASLQEPCQRHLTTGGFVLELTRDITPHVLQSCRETAWVHRDAFAAAPVPGDVREFLSVPGSQVYREMETGTSTYHIWRLRKSAGDGA